MSVLQSRAQRPGVAVPIDALHKRNVLFVRDAWGAGMRIDQRDALQLRELHIVFPLPTRDVVRVQLGQTHVLAHVACALVEPAPQRGRHGFVDVHVRHLLHERDATTSPNATTTQQQAQLARFLELLLRGGVLDTEGLCVLPAKHVWSISVNITIVNDDGNVGDAAQWAMMAALQHTRRPELTIRGTDVVVHPTHEREPVPLALHHVPLACTFAITHDAYLAARQARTCAASSVAAAVDTTPRPCVTAAALRVVADPSAEEMAAAACGVVVAMNAEGQVCALHKADGSDVPWEYVQSCLHAAAQLTSRVRETMAAAARAHEERRAALLRSQFQWAQQRSGVAATAVAAPATTTTVGAGATAAVTAADARDSHGAHGDTNGDDETTNNNNNNIGGGGGGGDDGDTSVRRTTKRARAEQ